jgi:DNA-binding response OmpR family regulator
MLKIMLIEDDTTMLSLLSTLLEFEGFETAKVGPESGLDETLERIRREKPELILLDVHLQGLSGFDLIRSLRKDESIKSTTVLMASGMELSIECREAGADGFILKPFMPDELVAKIRKMIEVIH